MVDYKDPRVIIRDEIDTLKEGLDYAASLGIPVTPDLMERMAVSSHIQADRNGYRGPVDERAVDSPDNGPEGEPVREQGNGSYDTPNYHAQTGEVSGKTVDYLGYRIDDACKIVVGCGTAPSNAKKVVRKTLTDLYKEEWGEEPDWDNILGMTQGQVSSLIDFTKTTWELR